MRLEEERLLALEERIDADLALGRSSELVPELEALVRDHPYRERLVSQLMLALYRSAQQARALEEYRAARRRLVNELGLEPGPELEQLQHRILEHDPSLESPAAVRVERSPRTPRPGRKSLVGSGAVAIAAAVAIGIMLGTGGTSASTNSAKAVAVLPNSVAAIDPKTNRVVDDIRVGNSPSRVAVAAGAVWVLNGDDRTVSRIDLATRAVRTVAVGGTPTDLTVANGAVWVVDGFAGKVYGIDSRTGYIERTVGLPLPNHDYDAFRLGAFAAPGRGAIWISGAVGSKAVGPQTPGPAFTPFLWRLDPVRNRVVWRRQGRATEGGGSIAVGHDAVWVGSSSGAGVVRVDPRSNSAATVDTPSFGDVTGKWLATGAGAIWEADRDGTLSKIDPFAERTQRSIGVAANASAVTVGFGSVWVTDLAAGTLLRVDPTTTTVVQSINLGGSPNGVAVGEDAVWVSVD